MNTPLVLIVGAGPTGMSMAIELKRAGSNVRIIDKSTEMAQHSQALIVQARTLEQLQRYGIASTAVEQGRKIHRVKFWSEGKNIVSFDLTHLPSRYPFALLLPQNITEAMLNQHMQSLDVSVERGTELIGLTQQNDVVDALVRHSDGSSEEISCRWIIGCDGAHSTVRKHCAIPFEGGGTGLSFFLGDMIMDGPDVPTDQLSLYLHHGDVIFMGPVTEKITRLIVALHSEQDKANQRELSLKDFQDAVDRANVRAQIHSATWMTPFNVTDRQAKHYRLQNAFLAGDAAHIHSPVGGQGMNTGIQDVANLAWKLAAVARGADDSLLDSYEEERGEVGKNLLKFTERGLKLATASNPIVQHIRDILAPLISKPQLMQNTFLGFISEIGIEYRSSSVVADHGADGHLRAGDRMPDLDIGKPGQRTTLLRDWTDAGHLAVLVNTPEDDARVIEDQLHPTKIISLSAQELNDEARHLLGTENKLLLIRPDGYIGFRAPADNIGELQHYIHRNALGMLAASQQFVPAE